MSALSEAWCQRRFDGVIRERRSAREYVLERLRGQTGVLVDFGCGPTSILQQIPLPPARIIGIDVDARAVSNSTLSGFCQVDLCRGERLPLPDASVDCVFSHFVFEHLPRPGNVVSELVRVLKPQGTMLLVLPNVAYPVFALSLAMERAGLMKWKLRLLAALRRREAESVYPAFYRMSRFSRIAREVARVAPEAQLRREVFFGGCWYGCSSRLLFWALLSFERLMDKLDWKAAMPYSVVEVTRGPLPPARAPEPGAIACDIEPVR